MRTITVLRGATSSDSETSIIKRQNSWSMVSEEIQGDSVALGGRGELIIYKDGEPYRMFNANNWHQVMSVENKIQEVSRFD